MCNLLEEQNVKEGKPTIDLLFFGRSSPSFVRSGTVFILSVYFLNQRPNKKNEFEVKAVAFVL